MLIWRGMGLAVVAIFGMVFLLVGLAFTKSRSDDWLHFVIACLVAGACWFLFMKRMAQHRLNTIEAEEQLQRPEYLDEKTRKRAEMLVKGKEMMKRWDDSHLFFIPIKWWHFVFTGLGIVFLCLHFFT